MKTCLAIVCALGLAWSSAFAAAFQNLDFDSSATNITLGLPPDQGVGYGPASDLVPGWQLFQGTDPVSLAGYDLYPISLGVASIYDSNSQGFPAPVSGRYSLGLYPGYNALFEYQPFSLVQTGDIGANVQSIRFINYGSPILAPTSSFLNSVTGGLITSAPSVITPNVINQPIFSSRKVTTSVSVSDVATVVLGGLMREDVQKTEDRTPIIGDIPIVGRLFRTNADQHVKRNLVIFVTAHLVTPAGTPLNSTEEDEEKEGVIEPPVLPQIPYYKK